MTTLTFTFPENTPQGYCDVLQSWLGIARDNTINVDVWAKDEQKLHQLCTLIERAGGTWTLSDGNEEVREAKWKRVYEEHVAAYGEPPIWEVFPDLFHPGGAPKDLSHEC